jgi:autotransporter-associated beta strand protein
LASGRIILGTNNAVSTAAPLEITGGSLDMNNFDQKVPTLMGTGGSIFNMGAAIKTLTIDNPNGESYSGQIFGKIKLVKNGNGDFKLNGDQNLYDGETVINGGRLISGTNGAFSDSSSLVMAANTTMDLNGFTQQFKNIDGPATARITNSNGAATSKLTVDVVNGETGTFAGTVDGQMQLIKSGPGTLLLNGNVRHTNPGDEPTTEVQEGVLGGTGTIDKDVTIAVGATLGGKLDVKGKVTNKGKTSPGDSAGILKIGQSVAASDTGLEYTSSGRYVWELTGNSDTNAGTNFDQIQLQNGKLDIDADAQLEIVFSGQATAPDLSTQFWQVEHEWKILDVTDPAQNAFSEKFLHLVVPSYSSPGQFSVFVPTATADAGDVHVKWSPVPEPTGALMAAVALGAMGSIRPRRSRNSLLLERR